MHFTKGWIHSEIGDVDVIAHEGRLHLFHLCLPNHDVVAHLVTEDGITWEPLPNALRTGDPGDCDDDQIWTMHAFRFDGRFYMLYTALCSADEGRIQRTGLAVSDDLIRWEKAAHNPVAAPDPRWYEADANDSGRADWRDPFPWVEDGVIHGLICAHEKGGPYNRRGCVAHVTSTDALHWQVVEPLYTPRISTDFEVPTVLKLRGRYYLIGHIVAPPSDVWRVADRFAGPYRRPPDDLLLPRGNHAFCPVVWRDKTLLYHWIAAEFDWTGAGVPGRGIAPPKEADALDDGTLVLRSFKSGWEALAAGPAESWGPREICDKAASCRGEWSGNSEAVIGACDPGMGLLNLPVEGADFVLETTVRCEDASVFGVVWRSDDTADQATRAALIPARRRIELHRIAPRAGRQIGRGHVTLQDNHCALAPGVGASLRVVAYGPYVEVSVRGRVLLSYFTMSRRAGRIGLFVEDGRAAFDCVRLTRLRPPGRFPL